MKKEHLVIAGAVLLSTIALAASQVQKQEQKAPVLWPKAESAVVGPTTPEEKRRRLMLMQAERQVLPYAHLALERGNYAESEHLYRQALPMIQVTPTESEAYMGLAQALEKQGKSAEAYSVYRQSFGISDHSDSYSNFPGDVEALARYGLLAEENGQYAEAVRVYKQARQRLTPAPPVALNVDFDPQQPQPSSLRAMLNVVRGVALDEQDKSQAALAAYAEAARLQPTQAVAQFYLGRGLQKAGRAAKAKSAFAKAVQFGRGDVRAAAQKELH